MCHVLQVDQLKEARKSVQLKDEVFIPNGVARAVLPKSAVDTPERDISDWFQTDQKSKVSSEGETKTSISGRREIAFLPIVIFVCSRDFVVSSRNSVGNRTLMSVIEDVWLLVYLHNNSILETTSAALEVEQHANIMKSSPSSVPLLCLPY